MKLDLTDPNPTFWLEVHCANCHGDEGNNNKKPFDKRAQWVNENIRLIKDVAFSPHAHLEKWKGVDSPFCFVAACRELVAAWRDMENFRTHLPVGFDGCCNGLQHLAYISGDPETAYRTNVGPDPKDGTWPREFQDAYAEIIEKTVELLLMATDEKPWAPWWLDCFKKLNSGQIRKLIKKPAGTYAYNAKLHSMAEKIEDEYDTFPGASRFDLHDATQPKGKRSGSHYLAKKIIEACKILLKEPTRVMLCIQHIAGQRIDRGQHLEWITPSSFPVLSRYHKAKKPVTFALRTYGVRMRHDLAVEFEDKPNRRKAINASAANFVHSLDASHAVKTINSARHMGIWNVITVHDCYYCRAPEAAKFRWIIGCEFSNMYFRKRNPGLLEDLRRHNDIPSTPKLAKLIKRKRGLPKLDPRVALYGEGSFA
jgi:DNA-directed RNA polymerase